VKTDETCTYGCRSVIQKVMPCIEGKLTNLPIKKLKVIQITVSTTKHDWKPIVLNLGT